MRHLVSTAAVAALLAFSAPAFADDYVLMKVNNTDVSATEVQGMLDSLTPPGQALDLKSLKPDMRDKLLRGVMTEKLLLGEAEKQHVDQSPEVARKLEDIKKKLVVQTFLEKKTTDMITEADLKRAYDEMVASMRDEKEIRARHILVPTEKEAQEVKAKLNGGASFEDVAKDYSKDPGSAKQGGDLGYFTKDKMVPQFADAAFKLKKGEISDPVKSPFGWHIIQVEDIRKVTVPTYNESKDMLRAKLADKKLADYIQGLVKDAKVTVYDDKGKEVPFDKNMPAPAAAAK